MGVVSWLKILIVDDAFVIREKLRIILKKAGHEVVGEAGNGLQATLMYKRLQPDIVTMDITMPEMDGLEALKLIRKMDSSSKVVMVSAVGKEDAVREAIINGATNFIVKPFKEDKVIEVLSRIK